MVPNHMGIDSRWVIEHPEWFLSLPEPPYPAYTFSGENLAEHDRVEVRLEDHYWDNSDAAVVFERRDRWSGERRYIYHGNDGTSFPWNDTAQLDFSPAAVREQVIQTILAVARRFPVIRFDAAMVLAKRHVRRLWFPAPGEGGGAIPSRAEFGTMTAAEFDAAMPIEFWREVVDRVATEVPDTLLLAEAFWMLEGYFVRTLGMHRVYNSAFMHMLRDEDNAGYRKVLKETLEFDPEILKRYVNFMNNPDEKTAVEQFGKGDKYFGVATLLATLPGLPMFGHGQFEGFAEKYGMEFRRATLDEQRGRVAGRAPRARDRAAAPPARRLRGGARLHAVRLRRTTRAASTRTCSRTRTGRAARGRWSSTTTGTARRRAGSGTPPRSRSRTDDGSKRLERRTLAEGLGLADGPARRPVARVPRAALVARVPAVRRRDPRARPPRGAARLRDARVLGAARARTTRPGVWRRLAERLGDRGVPSLEEELRDQQLGAGARRAAGGDRGAGASRASSGSSTRWRTRRGRPATRRPSSSGSAERAARARPVIDEIDDPSQAAALRLWTLLAPLGTLPAGAMVGPTSRAWYEELRLAPVVADALRGRGLDEAGAWWAAERVHTLLDLPLPSAVGGRGATGLPLRLVDAWLAHPVVRPFLRVNAWEGVEWFHRESWDELLAWVDRLEWILAPADGRVRRAPRSGRRSTRAHGGGRRVRLPGRPAARGARGARPKASVRRGGRPRTSMRPSRALPKATRPAAGPEARRAVDRRAQRATRAIAAPDRSPEPELVGGSRVTGHATPEPAPHRCRDGDLRSRLEAGATAKPRATGGGIASRRPTSADAGVRTRACTVRARRSPALRSSTTLGRSTRNAS